ncbi:RNA polymerase sigma factor [Streptomyces sp. NPDC050564]|uniref:RNA polymerase sigma factor n=1 Tax=Streptomyces sp. NPDC050564 TaxID=3365631 RepID=UPI00379431F6
MTDPTDPPGEERRRAAKQLVEGCYRQWLIDARKYVGSQLRDLDDADDLVQEAFLALFKRATMLGVAAIPSPPEEARKYFWGIMRNLLRNKYRDSPRRPKPVELDAEGQPGEPDPVADAVCKAAELAELRARIRALPRDQRAVMALQYDGSTNPEIAEQLAISVLRVGDLRKMAGRKLRKQMSEGGHDA